MIAVFHIQKQNVNMTVFHCVVEIIALHSRQAGKIKILTC